MSLFSGVACFGTYFVTTFEQLLVCRTLTGIGIGAASPVTFSLMGDYFGQDLRVHVSTYLGVMMSVGISFGQLLSGLIGPTFGWRAPFLLVSIPCIMFAILVLLTAKEPRRGDQENAMREARASIGMGVGTGSGMDMEGKEADGARYQYQAPGATKVYGVDAGAGVWGTAVPAITAGSSSSSSSIHNPILPQGVGENENEETELKGNGDSETVPTDVQEHVAYTEKIDWAKIKVLLRTPSVALILIQGVPGCVPWGIFYVYLNDYLSENKGFSVEEATIIVTMFGVGGLFGQWLGGWAGQRLYNLDKRYQIYLMGMSTILATAPLLVLVNTHNHHGVYPWLCVVAFVAGVSVLISAPNVNVVLQNVCAPETRGTGFALFTLTNDVGRGGGPLVGKAVVALQNTKQKTANRRRRH
jgi:predicted MFS family arabinose efflux permease